MILYVDNNSLLFNTREDMIKGITIYIGIIAKFSLTIDTRKGTKNSKTKAIFIPSITKLK